MALLLTGDENQALIALVIEEAHRAVKKKGGFVGRTAVQKLMYFLKASGVPMSYSFDIHHYGPYSEELQRDVEWLMADEVVLDESTEGRYSKYAPGPEAKEILSLHGDLVERQRENVRLFVNALAPMRPEELELFATLDYVYRKQIASEGSGPWKDLVIKKFIDVKGAKFARERVEAIYDAMVESGIFES